MGASPEPVLPLDWARQTGKVDAVMRTLEAKLQQRRQRRRTTTGVAAGSLAVVAFAIFWVVPYIRETSTVATLAARRQTLALADGSQADLNAQTSLHTDFRYGRRTVRLDQGEAFFSVAKDVEHPFLVETPAGAVRVTGTKFNVRLENGMAEVTLLEGKVEVQRSGAGGQGTAIHLIPGQQFASSRTELRTLSPAEMENTISWRTGRLALDGLTLGDAAERFGAYHGKTIAVAPDVALLALGGSCPLDDLPGFISFLKEAFPVHVLAQPDGSYRVVAAK